MRLRQGERQGAPAIARDDLTEERQGRGVDLGR